MQSPYDYFKDRLLHFYLILSRDCNLKCEFCYQPEKFRAKEKMPMSVAADTMEWIFENFDDKNVKVMLWGGEPLTNMEVLEYLVTAYPQIRFTVVTNGYLITKKVKEKLEKMTNNLHISLSVANAKKEHPDYLEKLENALDLVIKSGGDVHYVSADPKSMYKDYLKLEKMGIPLIRLSVPRDVEIEDEDLALIEKEWKKIVDHVYFEDKFNTGKTNFDRGLSSNLYPMVKGRPLDNRQPYFCGCGYLYMSVDVNGDIYPCDWFCGLGKLKYGNIETGIVEENVKKIHDLQANKDKMYKEFCKACEIPDIKLCPRAMCLAENLEKTGSLTTPQSSYCRANVLEHRVHKYLVERAFKEGKLS